MSSFFFFNDTATTEIYTLSLHDALPISGLVVADDAGLVLPLVDRGGRKNQTDRKSTRLNSSHSQISYAVFCLKKKKKNRNIKFSFCLNLVMSRHIHSVNLRCTDIIRPPT